MLQHVIGTLIVAINAAITDSGEAQLSRQVCSAVAVTASSHHALAALYANPALQVLTFSHF